MYDSHVPNKINWQNLSIQDDDVEKHIYFAYGIELSNIWASQRESTNSNKSIINTIPQYKSMKFYVIF